MIKLLFLHFSIFGLLTSICVPDNPIPKPKQEKALPPIIIYKTKKNYNKNVAVILSEDKSTIVSYPDPKDVFRNGSYCYPTPLKRGYLLDNRGINKNVAFLSITYETYAALKSPLSLDEMKKMIIDDNPLKVIYRCENTFSQKKMIDELNHIIKKRCKTCIKL
ncbi:MAG: hypothetical protein WC142_00775 [Bacteroidales bacterium]|jgi:hypothetical protein|nr:hypothetical protein [Bacteroidales bacterium]MDD2686925.1 hypothetical protein [Bacteroidales bacterium]MDD3330053.1 hypothetical protein [Bacteroidales bacterium]MDD3690859.1 hypothetical protein [Bacteroidales bacterium]MDD4044147.1 hypothetical protein [Bacteroidales bacterium]